MPLRLSVVTPARPVVDAEVDSVVAPGSEGEFGVLPGHAPFLMPLKPGVLRYAIGGRTERVALAGGFAEVTQERVTVLADAAEPRDEIEPTEAERRRALAAEALHQAGTAAPPETVEALRLALDRAEARIAALHA